jgi:hypothetical protein
VTIQDWGSVGELVGAAATVATLLYLALQIRANTAALRSDARRSIISDGATFLSSVGANLENTRVFRRGLTEFDDLDADERMQFFLQLSLLLSQTENAFSDFQSGMIDRESLEARLISVRQILATPGGVAWWNTFSPTMGARLREYLRAEVAALDVETKSPWAAA